MESAEASATTKNPPTTKTGSQKTKQSKKLTMLAAPGVAECAADFLSIRHVYYRDNVS
jgi:hypothetical protein